MKKLLLVHFILLTLAIPAKAQLGGMHVIPSGEIYGPDLVSTFSFNPGDSLYTICYSYYSSADSVYLDTTNMQPWQIGASIKPFFADSGLVINGIMTDTVNYYPANANAWFTIQPIGAPLNQIIGFDHKFETDPGHDGGIVEFSIDSGVTWQNVIGDCNNDLIGMAQGVLTDSFYSKTDTLITGEQAFSGNSSGWVHSRFQFWQGIPLKGSGIDCYISYPVIVRFRFVTDSITDSLAGWIIGNISITSGDYGSGIQGISYHSINISPNPSQTGIFNFPVLIDEKNYLLTITNSVGTKILRQAYSEKIDLSNYPADLYFYEATNGLRKYSGKLHRE